MLRKAYLYLFILFLINFVFQLWFLSFAQAIRATAGDGQIQISWLAPTQNEDGSILTDLAGFNIYRSLSEKGEPEKINSELVSGSAYLDTGLTNGQTYYYTVTAVDFSGNESVRSPMAFATPTILPPAGFTAIGDSHKIKLFWEKSENFNIRGYHLYRTLKPGQDYQKITMRLMFGIRSTH